MESAFAWLNQLIETFYRFFPHILIVRATHGGVSVAHPVMCSHNSVDFRHVSKYGWDSETAAGRYWPPCIGAVVA